MKREPAPLNLLDAEPAQAPWVCVTLSRVRGSAPREQGACMLVGATQTRGSIGGGHLEYKAIATARQLRARWAAGTPAEPHLESHALGPALGQCCGGHVELRYEIAASGALPAPDPLFHLQLFGAGHVGRALVRALRPLPCHIDWIDEREQEFPLDAFAPEVGGEWPSTLRALAVDAPEAEIATAPPGAFYLVMTHSHDLDFRLGETILRRADAALPPDSLRASPPEGVSAPSERPCGTDIGWFGLIGSATKRARFVRRWRERGVSDEALKRLVCPVGIPGIPGKAPEVIAASVAAQLLQVAAQIG